LTEAERLDALAALLGDAPIRPELFIEALSHGSLGGDKSYQRLEFLGDRVLGLCIADALYQRHSGEPEGKLSARLNALVSGATCAEVARAHGIPDLVILGKQARDDGGRESDNILGDVMEALIGATYITAGIDPARALILRLWADRVDSQAGAPRHPKSALQEWAAANRRKPPEYDLVDRIGAAHSPQFTVVARIPGLAEATGVAGSKQEAEKAAADALLLQVEARP